MINTTDKLRENMEANPLDVILEAAKTILGYEDEDEIERWGDDEPRPEIDQALVEFLKSLQKWGSKENIMELIEKGKRWNDTQEILHRIMANVWYTPANENGGKMAQGELVKLGCNLYLNKPDLGEGIIKK